jgi:undecaprenyl phosphate N,N'-diacetylbacillosamine 1-phosphate transferase
MYKSLIKPILDFFCSLAGFLVISPIFFVISFSLIVVNHGNPFFFQSRPGKKGKIFKVIKFKTMNNLRDDSGNFLADEKRLTSIGEILRKTSFDELPQLINVIKGDLSLVGPRPLLPEYMPIYNEEQTRRHEVRPGITGWAQVNGRNDISWEEKFKLDIWYVDNISFPLDIKILFMTISNVLKGKGISKEGHATTEKFNGQN